MCSHLYGVSRACCCTSVEQVTILFQGIRHPASEFKIIGNLPYYITQDFLRQLLPLGLLVSNAALLVSNQYLKAIRHTLDYAQQWPHNLQGIAFMHQKLRNQTPCTQQRCRLILGMKSVAA